MHRRSRQQVYQTSKLQFSQSEEYQFKKQQYKLAQNISIKCSKTQLNFVTIKKLICNDFQRTIEIEIEKSQLSLAKIYTSLKDSQILRIFKQILLAALFLNDNKLSHRGLSLNSIQIFQGTPKLSDLQYIVQTNSDFIQGEMRYIAPQLVSKEFPPNQKCDSFTLAVIYIQLKIKKQYQSKQDLETFRQNQKNKDWSNDIIKCVNVNPKQRMTVQQMKQLFFQENICWFGRLFCGKSRQKVYMCLQQNSTQLQFCRNGHQMKWRGIIKQTCVRCGQIQSGGFVCNKDCGFYCSSNCKTVQFNKKSRKCFCSKTTVWTRTPKYCFSCRNNVRSSFVCQNCEYAICVKCFPIPQIDTQKLCVNCHQYYLFASQKSSQKRPSCDKCGTLTKIGVHCLIENCGFTLCSRCSNLQIKIQKCALHGLCSWKKQLQLCFQCFEVKGHGFGCNSAGCGYFSCTKCSKYQVAKRICPNLHESLIYFAKNRSESRCCKCQNIMVDFLRCNKCYFEVCAKQPCYYGSLELR